MGRVLAQPAQVGKTVAKGDLRRSRVLPVGEHAAHRLIEIEQALVDRAREREPRDGLADVGCSAFSSPRWPSADPAHNCFPAGQGCGGIAAVQTCREIVDEFVAEATAVLSKLAS